MNTLSFLFFLYSLATVTCNPIIEENNKCTEGDEEYSREVAKLTSNNDNTFFTNLIKETITTTKQYSDLILHGGDNGTRGITDISFVKWLLSGFGLFQKKNKSVSRSSSQAHSVSKDSFVLTITENGDFIQKVISSPKPVIVMYSDIMCDKIGTCKKLTSQLENLVAKKEGNILFAKVDIGEVKNDWTKNIRALPTVQVFNNGNVLGTGLLPPKPLSEYEALMNNI